MLNSLFDFWLTKFTVICTPLTEAFLDTSVFAEWAKAAVPWGGGTSSNGADEVANAATWLSGEESGWITGVALPVDGGYHIHIA